MNNTILKSENDFKVLLFEKCVVCDIETNVPVNQHVDYRQYYVQGGGQLCKKCYENLDNKMYIKI